MPPRVSLSAFLATARSALNAPASKRVTPLTFVLGNESADLDSLCSALLYAYLRTHTPPHNLHIPLCHLARDDLTLRPEFTSLLQDAGTRPEDMLTLSDLPSAEDLRPEDTKWLLVDHNAMTGRVGQLYSSRVVGCIDHHADEDTVPRDAEPRIIGKTGSCISLVVQECLAAWDALPASADIDGQLARLSLGPILIDTANLGDKTKTTAADTDAVAYLESKAVAGGGSGTAAAAATYERGALFDRLTRLKEDLSPLSARDILRKDYKEWSEGPQKLGTSSTPRDFSFLMPQAGGRAAYLDAVGRWADERALDLLAVFTVYSTDGVLGRSLLLWARSGDAVAAARAFERVFAAQLELRPWGGGELDLGDGDGDGDGGEWRRCWTQGQPRNSRKQIAPMLRSALGGRL